MSVNRRLPLTCPDCGGHIYARHRLDCEWCRKPLPEEFRYTASEMAEFKATMDELDRARRERQARDEEIARTQDGASALISPLSICGM